ncbi:MAG TPA: homoserine O-succinyltransferase [Chloroflexi bacterium]|nr:homoserine O-succinyltransferase [Chloroflexota bacterium]|tara:strand:- start:1229 stop:2296 length:1068 start_codon:yes stop_codon:yes gene_type:complete
MPIVAHSSLPVFDKLRDDGQTVLTLNIANQQNIRELHIGLLNLMPDAALRVTEEQFVRLVGSCNQIAQLFVHPFSVSGLPRSKESQDYIDRYYMDFQEIRRCGLDALIITGANVSNPVLIDQEFWKPLEQVFSWALENVTSVLCSCLATHALLKMLYDIDRYKLPKKCWGVFDHVITNPKHPILKDINTRFDVPHSRYNAVNRDSLESADLSVLVETVNGDVHMAVSPDQFRVIYFQGHPEYYTMSLLKEYKREIDRYYNDELNKYPVVPSNYFSEDAVGIIEQYKDSVMSAKSTDKLLPQFPESELQMHIHNTWREAGKSIFNNWLGLIYQLTDLDRKVPFLNDVDPNNPLGIL